MTIKIVELNDKIFNEMDPDYLVQSIIGDIYEARTKLDKVTRVTKKYGKFDDYVELFSKDSRKFNKASTNNYGSNIIKSINDLQLFNATRKEKFNLTMRFLQERRAQIFINRFLADNESFVPNFMDEEDDPAIETRRFDNALRDKKYDTYEPKMDPWKKRKIIALMQQFVYQVRYMLPQSQALRRKYSGSYQYKIGFCLCQFRRIWFHLRRISATFVRYISIFKSLYIFMKLYERIVRLEVDMRDVVNYLKKLEYLRKLAMDPKFYDYSLESKK